MSHNSLLFFSPNGRMTNILRLKILQDPIYSRDQKDLKGKKMDIPKSLSGKLSLNLTNPF